jgi:cytochrome c oxidase accessory protein FixG
MSVKKAEAARIQGDLAGDCVDCHQCINVCPTGVDIRNGPSLGCIQCGLCIDACDSIMTKIGRPTRLIAYDTEMNIKRRLDELAPIYRIVRERTALYVTIIGIVGAIMLYTLATRATEDINTIHDRNPIFVRLTDGSIRNAYTVHILNKRHETRVFEMTVDGVPEAHVTVIGDTLTSGKPLVEVGPDRTRELRVLVTTHAKLPAAASMPLTFTIVDTKDGRGAKAVDNFVGP